MSKNRFSFFTTEPAVFRHSSTKNKTLLKTNAFIEAHYKQLFEKADPALKAKLLRALHQASPRTPENYLHQFIKDFEHNAKFADTIALYREKLAIYQQEKIRAVTTEGPSTASKQMTEAPTLTPQELDWQQLLETLKRCLNNRSTHNTLSWHPRHHENYYLAKLRIQWRHYEEKYTPIVLSNFSETLAHETAEGRRQTIIKNRVEAEQNLIAYKMEYTPTRFANQQRKLEERKASDLEEINQLVPEFIKYAEEIIAFAQQPANQEVQQIFKEAITEIQRQENAVGSNPALFKLSLGVRHKKHALATLDKIDKLREMEKFRKIFAAENATLSTTLKK